MPTRGKAPVHRKKASDLSHEDLAKTVEVVPVIPPEAFPPPELKSGNHYIEGVDVSWEAIGPKVTVIFSGHGQSLTLDAEQIPGVFAFFGCHSAGIVQALRDALKAAGSTVQI